MYRVLIADDEIHVCQLIQYLVDWDRLSLSLIGFAASGVDAFEKIVTQKPDIVISDIRMSGYSGIDLLEKTRALGLNCRFVLVSGYQQFEYAQKAIQFGVTDYIVKPIKKADLENALHKAMDELAPAAASAPPLAAPLAQPARADRERLVADLQSGALSFAQADVACLREVYGIDLSGKCCVIYFHFICHGQYFDETLHLLEGKAIVWMEKQVGAWFRESFLLRRDDALVLVCAASNADDMPGFGLIRDSCQAGISIFPEWQTVLGVAELERGQPLSAALHAAVERAHCHLFLQDAAVHRSIPPERTAKDFHEVIDYDACSRLVSAMQILDRDAVCAGIRAAFEAFDAARCLLPRAVYDFASWAIGEMNHALSAFEVEQSGAARYLDRAALEREFRHAASIRLLGLRLSKILEQRMDSVRAAVHSAENKPVRTARQMVAARYMEPLSLNDVAAAVDLNPVYLSVLFKKETGTNFKDYLTGVRIETAKALLREGESLLVVADKVGYKDAKYFSKLFTRIVGVNPTQYKKLYQ